MIGTVLNNDLTEWETALLMCSGVGNDCMDFDQVAGGYRAKRAWFSLGSISVQLKYLPDRDIVQRVDCDDLVVKDTSSYCTDLHPPLLRRLLRMGTPAHAVFRWVSRPLIAAGRVLKKFGRLRTHIRIGTEGAGLSR